GDASQARHYMNAVSLPFFQTYVAKKPEYISYLNAAYFQTISSQSLGLNLVQSFDHIKLAPVLDDHFHKNQPRKKKTFSYHSPLWILDTGYWYFSTSLIDIFLLIQIPNFFKESDILFLTIYVKIQRYQILNLKLCKVF
ncbi:MAG: hypothetical protein ACK5QA_02440, partial [Dolichospermum sp.]